MAQGLLGHPAKVSGLEMAMRSDSGKGEGLTCSYRAPGVKGSVVEGPALPMENKSHCLRLAVETKPWALG
jgi:hypothetical protein